MQEIYTCKKSGTCHSAFLITVIIFLFERICEGFMFYKLYASIWDHSFIWSIWFHRFGLWIPYCTTRIFQESTCMLGRLPPMPLNSSSSRCTSPLPISLRTAAITSYMHVFLYCFPYYTSSFMADIQPQETCFHCFHILNSLKRAMAERRVNNLGSKW